jgi:hypothetical protein
LNTNIRKDDIIRKDVIIHKDVISETKEISKVEIPIEELLAYIVAKIDHLGTMIEERFDKKVDLPHYK